MGKFIHGLIISLCYSGYKRARIYLIIGWMVQIKGASEEGHPGFDLSNCAACVPCIDVEYTGTRTVNNLSIDILF